MTFARRSVNRCKVGNYPEKAAAAYSTYNDVERNSESEQVLLSKCSARRTLSDGRAEGAKTCETSAGPAGAPILLRLAQLDPGSPGDTPAVSPSSSSRVHENSGMNSSRRAPPTAARMVLNALMGPKPDRTDRRDTQSLHLDADAYLQMNDEEAWDYLQTSIEQQQP